MLEELARWAGGGLVVGMALGALFLVGSRALHKRAVRRLVGEPTPRDYSPHQERVLSLSAPPTEASRRCREALETLNGGVYEGAGEDGCIRGRVPPHFLRPGAELTLQVQAEGEGSRVHVTSRPLRRRIRYDFGRGLEAVLQVQEFLEQRHRAG